MTYKTILVHVPVPAQSGKAVEAAVALAGRFGAHLIGMGAEMFDVGLMASAPYIDGTLIQTLRDQVELNLATAQGRFRKLAEGLGDRIEWLSTQDFPEAAIRLHARSADLVVASRAVGDVNAMTGFKPAELIMHAGAPVMLSPNFGGPLEAKQVVIGWKDTREARRAVSDAMPFLVGADMVHLVAVYGQGEVAPDREELEQVAQRIRRQGATVKIQPVKRSLASVSEDLEHVADLNGADLLVLGAYGHSRVREWVFGGVTEDLLTASSKYTLFSH
jgi:nucleotide-binding universal stress UspA family protein